MEENQQKPLTALTTKEGFESFVTNAMNNAKTLMEKTGAVAPVVILAARIHPETREYTKEPTVIPIIATGDFGPEAKEQFSEMIRAIAKDLEAFASVFISEAWLATLEGEKAREDLPSRLEDYAGKKEVILCHLEHQSFGRRMWAATVTRDAEGHATVTEFKPMTDWVVDESLQGRMTSFLPEVH